MIEIIDILQHSEGSFNHEQFGEIRTLIDEQGEPWFVGKDVAKALGYSNCNDALARHVDKEDKGVLNHDTLAWTQLPHLMQSGWR
ncbi:MAG: Bro-N domain-containing protein [Prevotella sp.]|nr:Bro-N domain-containing protein [Prevotella sp.]